MLFKYPELLWAFFLLLIPILIHLFQLRRFKKTPFTNVKLLQKVVAQSRKSSTIKKWLLLFSRLLLLSGLILAFSQPYFAKESVSYAKETVIYLDNSFSMQAKTENGTLLQDAVQKLLQGLPKDNTFSIFTNEQVFRNVTLMDIGNELLTLPYTYNQLGLKDVLLKGNNFFSEDEKSIKYLVLVSDFQNRTAIRESDTLGNIQTFMVRFDAVNLENTVLDSAYIAEVNATTIDLSVNLTTTGSLETIPVSLYNDDKLIAKTAATFDKNRKSNVVFTLPSNEVIIGKIEISDIGLPYDNQLFFNINQKDKIKVLSVSESDSEFLKRIFTEDEFIFTDVRMNNLNYSILESQNLIILNEIKTIPVSLKNTLSNYVQKGGHLMIIPAFDANIESYNSFIGNYYSTSFVNRIDEERNVTGINFDHPLYKNVFAQRVNNFQYPRVTSYFKTRTMAPKVLSLQDQSPFLVGQDGIYLFTAAMINTNSNFKNSPLIVPTIYSIGANSLKSPKLYNTMGQITTIDVKAVSARDNILKVTQKEYEFIPEQQSFSNKTILTFNYNPNKDGVYVISEESRPIQNISFNYPRTESEAIYADLDTLNRNTTLNNLTEVFETMEKDNRVTELWKWFAIFALLFMLAEVLIQKIFK
ncbi:BatA domain-containing protein [uncultured Eudoraea sp.]|uniref:BatA domain-containing protein n=1 Tax=uncultured Eudoraea sp. TaxID=1035614 RepID=UPI00260AD68F|nr:BatA domain-containing protein [uncultured Eudoraea sp.]